MSRSQESSARQPETLATPKTKKPSLQRQNTEISKIRQALSKHGDFLDPLATKRLQKRLEKDLSPAEIKAAESRLHELINHQKKQNIQVWQTLNPNLQTRKLTLTQFQHLALEEQHNIITNLERQKAEIQQQLDQFYATTGIKPAQESNTLLTEFNQQQTKKERATLIDLIKNQNSAFSTLQKNKEWKSLPKAKQTEFETSFNSLSSVSRQTLLDTLQENLTSNFLASEFKTFKDLFQQDLNLLPPEGFANFSSQNKINRARTIARARQNVISHIQQQYTPYLGLMPQKDLKAIHSVLPNLQLTKNVDLSFWLAAVPTQIMRAQKAAKVLKGIPQEIQDHYDLNNKYLFQINTLIERGIIQRLHSEKTTKHKKKFLEELNKHQSKNPRKKLSLFTPEEQQALQKKYEELNYEAQKTPLKSLELTEEIARRQTLADTFRKLPDQVRKEFADTLNDKNYASRSLLIQYILRQHAALHKGLNSLKEAAENTLNKAELQAEIDLITKQLPLGKAARQLITLKKLISSNTSLNKSWEKLTKSPEYSLLTPGNKTKVETEWKSASTDKKESLLKKLSKQLQLEIPTPPAKNENTSETQTLKNHEQSIDTAVLEGDYPLAKKLINQLKKLTDSTDLNQQLKLKHHLEEVQKLEAINNENQETPFEKELEQLVKDSLTNQHQERQALTRLSVAIQTQEQVNTPVPNPDNSNTITIEHKHLTANPSKSSQETCDLLAEIQQAPHIQAEIIILNKKGTSVSAKEMHDQRKPLETQIKEQSARTVLINILDKYPNIPENIIPQLKAQITQTAEAMNDDFLIDLSLRKKAA